MLEPTARQQQVLDLLAAGNSVKEIGAVLGISPNTVEVHLEKLKLKLRVSSIREIHEMLLRQRLRAMMEEHQIPDWKIKRILEKL